VLRRLTSTAAVGWLTRFTAIVDASLVRRLISIARADDAAACWCFCGASGRGETLTRVAPELLMIIDEAQDVAAGIAAFHRVSTALGQCGYLPTAPRSDGPVHAAAVSEWIRRYRGWISDPVIQNMYGARQLFDLKPIHGALRLWTEVDDVVRAAINHDFLHIVANDCLESLPPLTFYEDAVIADSGQESAVFRLEYSALAPLVDVGRVFGLAAGRVLGTSTLERFAVGRTLLPDRTSILREAEDTLRVVLWQQGRVGISQNSDGAELPPALLGRYDRRLLKSGFRSISRLLEFVGNPQWLKTI
jgi:CBS domain-containing protein